MSKATRYLNIKTFLIILVIIVFIFINSSQETYLSLEEISENTLETIQTSTNQTTTPTTDNTTSTPYTPPDYSYPTNNNPVGSNEPKILIPILVGAMILGIIGLLLLRKKNYTPFSYSKTLVEEKESTISKRRQVFRTQIITLKQILEQYLDDGNYTEGIIYGFQKMDENMKKLLGLKRDYYLTPREFSDKLNLPEIKQYLIKIVDLFYLARYNLKIMEKKDLKSFISNLEQIQSKSKVSREIEVIRKTIKEEVENGY